MPSLDTKCLSGLLSGPEAAASFSDDDDAGFEDFGDEPDDFSAQFDKSASAAKADDDDDDGVSHPPMVLPLGPLHCAVHASVFVVPCRPHG